MLKPANLIVLAVTLLLAACYGSSTSSPDYPGPLASTDVNLVFVVSEDLTYNAPGDIDPGTANLTPKGLQRSLQLAGFLQQQVLGNANVTAIHALQPMSHLQTAANLPDLGALVTIQQFALQNRITLPPGPAVPTSFTGNSFPLNVSYAIGGPLPPGVAPPQAVCATCQGLHFRDDAGHNLALATSIIKARTPGFYVFVAPWSTTAALLADIARAHGYRLPLPTVYEGPNRVYALVVPPASVPGLVQYDAQLDPPATYPVLPQPLPVALCNAQTHFTAARSEGVDGAVLPKDINHDQTVYFVRHAEAHPADNWDDGNYVGVGQWRALGLPGALRGKIAPDLVYSIDPAQVILGGRSGGSNYFWSYVRPALTVAPYAIANKLPYQLAASFELFAKDSPKEAAEFFFKGGKFSNRTLLVAWEHDHIPPTVNALLEAYGGTAPKAPEKWPGTDYDTIWTVRLDARGNVTVNNQLCEGIDTSTLPATPPLF